MFCVYHCLRPMRTRTVRWRFSHPSLRTTLPPRPLQRLIWVGCVLLCLSVVVGHLCWLKLISAIFVPTDIAWRMCPTRTAPIRLNRLRLRLCSQSPQLLQTLALPPMGAFLDGCSSGAHSRPSESRPWRTLLALARTTGRTRFRHDRHGPELGQLQSPAHPDRPRSTSVPTAKGHHRPSDLSLHSPSTTRRHSSPVHSLRHLRPRYSGISPIPGTTLDIITAFDYPYYCPR